MHSNQSLRCIFNRADIIINNGEVIKDRFYDLYNKDFNEQLITNDLNDRCIAIVKNRDVKIYGNNKHPGFWQLKNKVQSGFGGYYINSFDHLEFVEIVH